MKPFTEIWHPGPNSKDRFENRVLRGTALELMDDRRELRREMPSPLATLVGADRGARASGSVGDERYMMS